MDGPKSGDHQLIGVHFECFFHGGDWKAFLLLSSLLLSIPIFEYHHFNFSQKRSAAIFLNIKSLSASMFFVDKQLYWILSAAFRFVYARHSAARYPHRHDRQRLAERLQVGETDQTEASSLAIQIHDCRRKCLKRHWFFTSNLRQTLDV